MGKLQQKEVKREEAAPTFPTMKQRLEEKEQALRHEMEQFMEVLKVLGTPLIEEPAVHLPVVQFSPFAVQDGSDFLTLEKKERARC